MKFVWKKLQVNFTRILYVHHTWTFHVRFMRIFNAILLWIFTCDKNLTFSDFHMNFSCDAHLPVFISIHVYEQNEVKSESYNPRVISHQQLYPTRKSIILVCCIYTNQPLSLFTVERLKYEHWKHHCCVLYLYISTSFSVHSRTTEIMNIENKWKCKYM